MLEDDLTDELEITAEDAAEIVLKEFQGDDRTVTVEMLARLYSTLFSQQEALNNIFALLLKSDPKLVFETEIIGLRRELTNAAQSLTRELVSLADSRPNNGE